MATQKPTKVFQPSIERYLSMESAPYTAGQMVSFNIPVYNNYDLYPAYVGVPSRIETTNTTAVPAGAANVIPQNAVYNVGLRGYDREIVPPSLFMKSVNLLVNGDTKISLQDNNVLVQNIEVLTYNYDQAQALGTFDGYFNHVSDPNQFPADRYPIVQSAYRNIDTYGTDGSNENIVMFRVPLQKLMQGFCSQGLNLKAIGNVATLQFIVANWDNEIQVLEYNVGKESRSNLVGQKQWGYTLPCSASTADPSVQILIPIANITALNNPDISATSFPFVSGDTLKITLAGNPVDAVINGVITFAAGVMTIPCANFGAGVAVPSPIIILPTSTPTTNSLYVPFLNNNLDLNDNATASDIKAKYPVSTWLSVYSNATNSSLALGQVNTNAALATCAYAGASDGLYIMFAAAPLPTPVPNLTSYCTKALRIANTANPAPLTSTIYVNNNNGPNTSYYGADLLLYINQPIQINGENGTGYKTLMSTLITGISYEHAPSGSESNVAITIDPPLPAVLAAGYTFLNIRQFNAGSSTFSLNEKWLLTMLTTDKDYTSGQTYTRYLEKATTFNTINAGGNASFTWILDPLVRHVIICFPSVNRMLSRTETLDSYQLFLNGKPLTSMPIVVNPDKNQQMLFDQLVRNFPLTDYDVKAMNGNTSVNPLSAGTDCFSIFSEIVLSQEELKMGKVPNLMLQLNNGSGGSFEGRTFFLFENVVRKY